MQIFIQGFTLDSSEGDQQMEQLCRRLHLLWVGQGLVESDGAAVALTIQPGQCPPSGTKQLSGCEILGRGR